MRSGELAALWCLSCALLFVACGEDEDERSVVPLPDIDASFAAGAREGGLGDGGCEFASDYQDFDHDGFTRAQGDCDECDPKRGPGAIEVPMNGIDDDCQGGDATGLDAGMASCDVDLDPQDTTLDAVAAALGLCRQDLSTASREWGLISDLSGWRRLDGVERLHDPLQVWLPQAFGTIAPLEGARLLVLSTGVARTPGTRAYTRGCDVFSEASADAGLGPWGPGAAPPEGYPRDSTACGKAVASAGTPAYDDVGLELTLRVPTNASGIAFDSIFFTYEYPDFVCSPYNDFFVVLMDPAPRGAKDDNVLFDEEGDPIGVNTGLLQVCTRTTRAARAIACSRGGDLLTDTGYGPGESTCASDISHKQDIGGAATGWLHTEVAVEPGALVKLRFVLWDSGDPLLDSTVVIDNFRFLVGPPTAGTRPLTSG